MGSRFPFSSFPAGWFRVGASDELSRRTVSWNGQTAALPRSRPRAVCGVDGYAHVTGCALPAPGAPWGLIAKCGASTIQCPVHGWRLNRDGRCASIPHAAFSFLETARATHKAGKTQIFLYCRHIGDMLSRHWPEDFFLLTKILAAQTRSRDLLTIRRQQSADTKTTWFCQLLTPAR